MPLASAAKTKASSQLTDLHPQQIITFNSLPISPYIAPLLFCMNNRLTIYILIAMAAGIALGYWVYVAASPAFAQSFADNIRLLTKIFLNLVQMIIAPLVFSTLVVGIAKLGDLHHPEQCFVSICQGLVAASIQAL